MNSHHSYIYNNSDEHDNKQMITDEARYKILRALQAQPDLSQRELADQLGISLGKVNYCLNALIQKGSIKAKNFSKSEHKKRYLYLLTPAGIESKARLTRRFLQYKMEEFEALKAEIEDIRRDLDATTAQEKP
ncbi:MarR family EPS-associated transcriptional regulator [Pseudohongiella spirulinae]|uniref:Transcriptional regulator n=1 Tax=Pseudohongiella spirulinae TaxID=1249552 RepID=A0A0S2KDN6_9GAMM|nr:transcriptional regulator [Pseudohongiella spirulinae]